MTETPPPDAKFSPGWSDFTADWFTHRIPAWRKHILPVYEGKPCRWLEIGSYEGRSALWTLQHILTHHESRITCADIWNNPEVEARFDANLGLPATLGRFRKIKGDSKQTLRHLEPGYDVVYVDGDHQAKSAMADAVLAWPLLKSGGYMIFDDYKWNFLTQKERETKIPASKAIDAFLQFWRDELKIVHHDYQVIVQKL